ncbi:hypothetical protein MJM86_24795, partial [Salmonella enterica subsp. enterica serovar Kentucky]|nr:hypothetical protein [Salmonella enterica subsp. enterica serovar Kentucky]
QKKIFQAPAPASPWACLKTRFALGIAKRNKRYNLFHHPRPYTTESFLAEGDSQVADICIVE